MSNRDFNQVLDALFKSVEEHNKRLAEKRSQPIPDDDYMFIPVEVITNPNRTGYLEYLQDCYYLVHPEHGIAFYNPKTKAGRRRRRYGSVQCNHSEWITNKLNHKGWTVVHLEHAWIPIDPNEFGE